MNFVKFLRAPFLIEDLWWLPLREWITPNNERRINYLPLLHEANGSFIKRQTRGTSHVNE